MRADFFTDETKQGFVTIWPVVVVICAQYAEWASPFRDTIRQFPENKRNNHEVMNHYEPGEQTAPT